MEELNRVTYVANAGVLIELGNKKILIDGFCNSVLPIYKNPPKTLKEQMILEDLLSMILTSYSLPITIVTILIQRVLGPF